MTTQQLANFALISLALTGQANALLIETSTLDNAYIEALPNEQLGNGGIAVVAQPIPGVGSVTNPDPTFFRSSDEEDEELRTREGSTIETIRHRVRLSDVGANPGRVPLSNF